WQHITDQMDGYFPGAQPTYVWIVGRLDSGVGIGGTRLEFEKPNDDVDYAALNISFGPPTKAGHLSHEDYLNYFDEHGIKVFLQVEPGFADMKTLMDLIFDKYGHHSSVIGWGVDVEWYYGISEDAGLPVTDALAKDWDEHLKSINPTYRMFLKHYSMRWLPPTYRSDILFCNDSQSIGSIDGEVTGMYDDTMGFIPEFKAFADFFYPNDVLYQIGYRPDAMWYYTLDEPVIKTLSERLAEVTRQKIGIAWVDFTIKDPLTFPALFKTDAERVSAVNTLVGYLRNNGNNMVGKRFGADAATLTDAMFVAKLREVVNSLTDAQRSALNTSYLTNLINLEPKAIDIRIANLDVAKLKIKDKKKVADIRAAYIALTDVQKAQVTKLDSLVAAENILKSIEDGDNPPTNVPIGNGTDAPTAGGNVEKQLNADGFVTIKASELTSADSLTINRGGLRVAFDKSALASFGTVKDIVVSVTIADTSGLSDEDKARIGDRPVYEFSVKSGDNAVTSFGNGVVTISVPYTLKAEEDLNAIVIYYINSNAKLEVIKDCIYDPITGTVTFKTNHFSRYSVGYNKINFSDVSGWYQDYVTFLSAREVIKGQGEKQFAPNANITRAEFVQILANMAGADLANYKIAPFADVKSGDWYLGAVSWAYDNGIATGANGKFNPNANITRQDMAVLIGRYVDMLTKSTLPNKNEATVFADEGNIDGYAKAAVLAMQRSGIIEGRGNNIFDPKAKATRAEAAKMITTLIKIMVK
ncbi:S-layer homology domain-containing protein, partial [Paenibacillus castaneae]